MRPMNHVLIGAILAATPVLVASEALAAVSNSSESCGDYAVGGDAQCAFLVGGECEEECEDTDMSKQSKASCLDECEGGGLKALFCLVSCVSDTVQELEADCSAGCSGEGSLFCSGSYLHLEDVGLCLDELCSLGVDLGDVCEEEEPTDPPPNEPNDPSDPGQP